MPIKKLSKEILYLVPSETIAIGDFQHRHSLHPLIPHPSSKALSIELKPCFQNSI